MEKTEKPKEKNPDKRFQQNGETPPKTAYDLSMAWEVEA
jgi:hypothetical protein